MILMVAVSPSEIVVQRHRRYSRHKLRMSREYLLAPLFVDASSALCFRLGPYEARLKPASQVAACGRSMCRSFSQRWYVTWYVLTPLAAASVLNLSEISVVSASTPVNDNDNDNDNGADS